MNVVLTIHSINRWIIVIIAVVALIRFTFGWLSKKEYRPMDRGLMSAFVGLLDLQVLLGIILLIGRGTAPFQLEHAFTMFIAVILAHFSIRWRNAEDPIKFRNNSLVIVADLVLIFIGITTLPQGWFG
jgi:uncharacterized membrane protein YphA (DoxX/SURF4 family)